MQLSPFRVRKEVGRVWEKELSLLIFYLGGGKKERERKKYIYNAKIAHLRSSSELPRIGNVIAIPVEEPLGLWN